MGFRTSVIRGKALENYVSSVSNLAPRRVAENIRTFLDSGQVILVYGLRQTGKTIAMRHAISSLSQAERERTAFIICSENDEFRDLRADMLDLEKEGIRNIFIDEVTYLKDFSDSSSLFSNYFAARGVNIVLAGTHSLSFLFSSLSGLAGKSEKIRTTWIPYGEFTELKGTRNIDSFLMKGGILGDLFFRNRESANEYAYTAIADNIQHSLENWRDGQKFGSLLDLYDRDILTDAIVRVVESRTHNFISRLVNKKFKSAPLGMAMKNLGKRSDPDQMEAITRILGAVDVPMMTLDIIRRLNVRDGKNPPVKPEEMAAMEEWFKELDLLVECSVKGHDPKSTPRKRWFMTQQGMRAAHLEAVLDAMLEHESLAVLAADERRLLIDAVRQGAYGEMIEETILLDTINSLGNSFSVFSYELPNGEYDMVVKDRKSDACHVFEIKHSSERNEAQIRHLVNDANIGCLKKSCGNGFSFTLNLLYDGEETTVSNVNYINIDHYLKRLWKTGELPIPQATKPLQSSKRQIPACGRMS